MRRKTNSTFRPSASVSTHISSFFPLIMSIFVQIAHYGKKTFNRFFFQISNFYKNFNFLEFFEFFDINRKIKKYKIVPTWNFQFSYWPIFDLQPRSKIVEIDEEFSEKRVFAVFERRSNYVNSRLFTSKQENPARLD